MNVRCGAERGHQQERPQTAVFAQSGFRGAAGNPPATLLRRELVAERAARCALHDGLVMSEAHFAVARLGNVEIGFTHQQRAEFRLAEHTKELCEPAVRYVDVKRSLIVAVHLHRNIALEDFGPGGLYVRPSAAPVTINTAVYSCEQPFRPAAQGLLDDRVRLFFTQFGVQRS